MKSAITYELLHVDKNCGARRGKNCRNRKASRAYEKL